MILVVAQASLLRCLGLATSTYLKDEMGHKLVYPDTIPGFVAFGCKAPTFKGHLVLKGRRFWRP